MYFLKLSTLPDIDENLLVSTKSNDVFVYMDIVKSVKNKQSYFNL